MTNALLNLVITTPAMSSRMRDIQTGAAKASRRLRVKRMAATGGMIQGSLKRYHQEKMCALREKSTASAVSQRIALVGLAPVHSAATAVETASTPVGMLTMTKPQRHLSAVHYSTSAQLRLRFGDGDVFLLPVGKLEMPVEEIDWPTATVSPDGTAMTVRKIGGREITIDAGAIRCMVDENYAAQAKEVVDEMQLTRDELRELLKVSTPPPRWDEDLA